MSFFRQTSWRIGHQYRLSPSISQRLPPRSGPATRSSVAPSLPSSIYLTWTSRKYSTSLTSRTINPYVSSHLPGLHRPFHATSYQSKDNERDQNERASGLDSLDVFTDTPVPAISIDICMSDGFLLNNGIRITNGDGVLLVAGEAFRWRPWLLASSASKEEKEKITENSSVREKLQWFINSKGQWEVPKEALGLLEVLWPRPGLGPSILPLSPDTRRFISELGCRVEVLDTRNAASQFNLLATERGLDNVAGVLLPVG